MTGRLVAFAAVLAVPLGLASAEEPFRHARVRVVEPGVTLQSATETSSEEAVPNMPFLPGDRVWTDARGRIELHFADGSLLRVDSRSKLDYDGYDRQNGGQVVLRLWSGSVYVHQQDGSRSPEFLIETPSAAASLQARGVYRVDAVEGETRLSVFEGDASLDAADRARVRSGERAFARRGDRILGPDRFDRREAPDDFARWDAELGGPTGTARGNEYLPEELSPFAEDFQNHGAWSFEAGVGNVWRPYVSSSWAPYSFGRWAWTAYGWTWVPSEPWGWAPSHYGRWGYASGWYWIPGNTWGPGWVSWSAGHDYVGWCPLGYGNQAVVVQHRGRAVPRGSVASSSPWTYVRRVDLASRDVARRRVDATAVPVAQMRPVDMARARITREGTVAEGAVPRNVRARPGVGDTVPELRTDNQTTIPRPVARTRYESEAERERETKDGEARNPSWSPRGRREPADSGVRQDARESPDVWSWGGRRAMFQQPSPEATPSPRPDAAVRRRPEASRTEDGDREALRPWFDKLRKRDDERAAPPPRDEQASPRQRSRQQDTPRAEPRQIRTEPKPERQSPPPPPPPPPKNDGGNERGAVRRERSRDQ